MARYDYELALGFIETHLDAAVREIELQPADEAAALLLAIPLAPAQRLLSRMLPAYAARIIAAMTADEAAGLLAGEEANQVAAILRYLTASEREQVLGSLPDRLARKCHQILRYPRASVGAWMNVDALILPQNITAGDALHRVAQAGDLGDGNAVPVVTEARELQGYVGVSDMLRARSETLITRLLRDIEPVAIPARMSLRAAERHPGWQQHDNLIVISRRNQVEGLLRHSVMRAGLQLGQRAPVVAGDSSVASELGRVYLNTLTSLLGLAASDVSTRSSIARPNPGAGS